MPERVTASALSVPQRLALIAGVVAALMLAAIAVASGAIGGDDRTSNLSQQAPATPTPPPVPTPPPEPTLQPQPTPPPIATSRPTPAPTPPTILGTTDGPLQIGGGPPRFATGDSSDLPTSLPLPLPDTTNAVDAVTGRALLAGVPVVRDVLEAIETSDIGRLAGMVQTFQEFCGGRTEELRRQCVELAGPDYTFEASSVSGTSQPLP